MYGDKVLNSLEAMFKYESEIEQKLEKEFPAENDV